ncbi:asparagine synthetase [Halalkalibacter akibai JCM 9157]|uniref:asparagine synthase (glutamine-hydrolyzing) n=1 Tax=Halalkalibacter akibai (strain ATCC 43226 / DSM 21942 / CIP 109018 / JCM 9157 / 1139) TaxID=1236973 RepID=W4QXA6_HALA3|nr:asparagine synthetase [Halalkalibacter akibai JCM 9157]
MSDSELILLSYFKWKEDCPKFLVGDFAFMIWDKNAQKMFGARDYSGYRTLYYYSQQGDFAFCTTIEGLLKLPYIEKKINQDWFTEYLAIGGMMDTLDGISTPYKFINQIPPAHSISITKDTVSTNKYITLKSLKPIRYKSDDEYVEHFKEIFEEAVTDRLRSNKKIGSQLSGGLDSGAVASFAARYLKSQNKNLDTFSYIPPSDFKDFTPKNLMADERPFIKSTIQYIGNIKDHYFDFSDRSSYSEINELLDIIEFPYKFHENSFWLKGIFEAANEKGIGILLNGDRGNFNVSWGNALYHYSSLLKKIKWFRLFEELNYYSKNVGGPRLRRIPLIAKIAYPFLAGKQPMYDNNFINPELKKNTNVLNKLTSFDINESGSFKTKDINRLRLMHLEDLVPWNSGNTLNCKLSLRHSLWKRDPTHDLRVIRYCLSIPDDQFVQKGLDRALIRRATKNYLPDKVRLNQRIRGVQSADWVHRMDKESDKLISELNMILKDERLLTLVNKNKLEDALHIVKNEGFKTDDFTNPNYTILMRCLIISRFLKKF